MTSPSWTDERIDHLQRLWKDGLSASEIAVRLGGVTRNAVLGKLHRLGLLGSRPRGMARSLPARPARAAPAQPRRPARTPAIPAPDPRPEIEDPATVTELQHLRPRHCRWPIGDPLTASFRFCGRRAEAGPYCPGHRAMAYRPAAATAKRGGRPA